MEILHTGRAHKHDRITVTCSFCDSIVSFWRDEPGTETEYIGDETDMWIVKFKCPVCETETTERVGMYDASASLYGMGLEKDRVLSKEEKEEIDEIFKTQEEEA